MANPEARLSELPLLADAEREQLVVAWNQTEVPFPWDASVSEVFERQAAQTPEALALEHGTTRWTYRELNARANRLAHVLRETGVQIETLVGLCLERSAGMVLAMLAVLKAGGAYVPIDPGYPAARRSLMLESVPVLVTARSLASEFTAYAGCILRVEDAQTGPAGTENLPRWANGDSLAYVIYTSGSTGQPKGVAIPHRAVNRLVLNTNYIALDGSDVVAQTANCCFDAATFEVWGALLNGACLAIIDQEVLLSWARILAGRFRGKAGGHFLQWNERYQKAKARRRRLLDRDQAAEIDLHVVMVHTRALWAYRPLPFDGKITLFRSRVPEVGYEFDPYLGWNFLAQGGIEVHEMPGAHLELFADENVPNLAKVLDGCIRSALAPDSANPTSPWNLPTGAVVNGEELAMDHRRRSPPGAR